MKIKVFYIYRDQPEQKEVFLPYSCEDTDNYLTQYFESLNYDVSNIEIAQVNYE